MTNKRIWAGVVCIALISLICLSGSIHAEEKSGQTPLVLTGAIPLPNVQGRIDHFGFDAKGRVFVSALGNNTLEVIDTSAQRDVHTITDVPTPQGVVFSPETNKRLDDVKVGAHPESFQLEFSGPRVFVNLPDTKEVAVVNRKTHEVRKWQMTLGGNFPMALDEADHRIFVATRSPARLVVLDADSGHMVATLPSVQDADDLYFDAERKRIYVPGGEGYISVFQQRDPDHYDLIVKIQTAVGARTAGYFGKMGKKGFDRLYLAVPARAGRQAEIQIYTVQD